MTKKIARGVEPFQVFVGIEDSLQVVFASLKIAQASEWEPNAFVINHAGHACLPLTNPRDIPRKHARSIHPGLTCNQPRLAGITFRKNHKQASVASMNCELLADADFKSQWALRNYEKM